MKKFLAIILTAISLLQCFGTAAAFAEETGLNYAAQSEEFEQAVNLLKELEIADFETAGATDASTVLTRAQFVSMLMQVVYPNAVIEAKYNPFNDLKSGDFGYEAILKAYAYNLVRGDGTNVNPNGQIEYADAAELILRAMGYEKPVNEYNFNTATIKSKLLKGTKRSQDGTVTFGQAAKLFANALELPLVEPFDFYTESGFRFDKEDESTYLRVKVYNIYKTNGILFENSLTSIKTQKSISGENNIVVGSIKGKMYNSNVPIDCIGMNVRAYYRTKEDGNNVFLYVYAEEGLNNIYTVDIANKESFKGGVLSYYENDKVKKLNIPASAVMVYNGQVTPTFDNKIFDFNEGSLTAVDNNCDGRIDVVNILCYSDMVVKVNSSVEEKIFGENQGEEIDTNENSERKILITDNNLQVVSIKDVSAGAVLTYAQSKSKEYIRGFVSDTVEKGSVTKTATEDGVKVVWIGGKKYSVSKNFSGDINVGEEGSFKINYFGKIVDFEKETSSEKQYGFVAKCAVTDGTFEKEAKLMIFDTYGTFQTYKMASRYVIDDSTTQSNLDLFETSKNKINHKLVIFGTNGAGEVNYIDTYEGGEKKDGALRSILGAACEYKYYNSLKTFYGRLPANNNAIVMSVPTDENDTDEKHYSIMSMSGVGEKFYKFQGFTTKLETYTPDVIVLYSDTSKDVSSGGTGYVFVEVCQTLDADGIAATGLSVFDTKGNEQIVPLDTELLDYIETKKQENPDTSLDFEKWNKGDYIVISKDLDGVGLAVDKVYDCKTKTVNPESYYYQYINNFGADGRPQTAFMLAYENGYVAVTTDKDNINEDTFEISSRLSAAKYLICEPSLDKKGWVRTVTDDDLLLAAHKQYPVFAMHSSGHLGLLIIYVED